MRNESSKWGVVLVTCLSVLSSGKVFAASDDLIQSSITADSASLKGITIVGNLVSALGGQADVEVRGRVSPHVQWVAGASVGASGYQQAFKGDFPGATSTADSSGVNAGLSVGANFFVLGHAPSGLWIGPRLGAIYQGGKSHSEGGLVNADNSVTAYSYAAADRVWGGAASAMLGFTQVLKPGITLELAAGPQVTLGSNLQALDGGLGQGFLTTYGVRTWVGLGWTL